VQDGGLGLPMKVVQERMGHSTITLTADVYGHLFPSDDHGAEMNNAMEKSFPALIATQTRHIAENSFNNNA
jgi:hypothetical protein